MAAAKIDVTLLQKALAFEEKQEARALKLSTQKDATTSLVPQYDPLVSTEALYKDTPLSALRFSKAKPRVKDEVLIIAGPDKGRAGVLLGIEKESAIVKLTTRELKIVDIQKIAKALPPE